VMWVETAPGNMYFCFLSELKGKVIA
jgi:hypothetical protein